MTKQIIDFQKDAFSTWFGVIRELQEQSLSSVNKAVKQADWMPQQGRRMVLGWINACKEGGDRYKAYLDESFSSFENYFDQETGPGPSKSKKPTTNAKTIKTPKAKKAKTTAVAAAVTETKVEKPAIEKETIAVVSAPKPVVKSPN